MIVVLVLASWLSVLVPTPKWLAMVFVFGFSALGALFLLFGAAGWYWDSHMNSSNEGMKGFIAGVLMVVPQLVTAYRRFDWD